MRLVPLVGLVTFLVLLAAWVARPKARALAWRAQLALALVLGASGLYVGLAWAPAERHMGDLARIMHVHVPLVWMGLLSLAVNFFASVAWLLKASRAADALAEASAEVGVALGLVGLGVGAIWGYPTWGVWWSWDPRMVATAGMLLLYAAYLGLRRVIREEPQRAFASALVAMLVSVALPLVWFSVRWWSSLHQLQSSRETMDPAIFTALAWNAVAALCTTLVLTTARYEQVRASLERGSVR